MDIGLIVDGGAVAAEGGGTFERKDPMTGKVATRAPAATLADVEKVVAAAAKAFETWSETGPSLSATSMGRPSPTRLRCHSAAQRPAGTAASAERPSSTNSRWPQPSLPSNTLSQMRLERTIERSMRL
jgi:hypothetical protein